MSSGFLHVVADIKILFLFMAEQYSTAWIDHILIFHSSINRHLGCFYLLATVNNAAVNVCVQYQSKFLLSILLRMYLEEEMADSNGTLCITLRLSFIMYEREITAVPNEQGCCENYMLVYMKCVDLFRAEPA